MLTSRENAKVLWRNWPILGGKAATIEIDAEGMDEGEAYDLAGDWLELAECVSAYVQYGADDEIAVVRVNLGGRAD